MKIKEFKKLDVDSKLDVIFKELIMLRKINTIQEEEINVSKRYIIEVIHPAIQKLFKVPAISEELKEDKIDEMVEFLKSNGYIVFSRV